MTSSAFCFALVTCGVKFLSLAGWPNLFISWGRFFVGTLILSAWFSHKKKLPIPNHWGWVSSRAFFNFIAVSFFYLSVSATTLAKANLLNMSYPLFIALLAPFLLGEKSSAKQLLAVLCSSLGVVSILGINPGQWNQGDVYGIICGVLAAFSILSLRAARASDSSDTILFYVMLFGTVGLAPFLTFPESVRSEEWLLFLATSLGGVLGQYFLTMAYKNIEALEGAIASSTRLIFASIFGFYFFAESITISFILGSLLILYGIFIAQKK